MRIVNLSKYKAHTNPIFKQVNILKVQDILRIKQFTFINSDNTLPAYLRFNLITREHIDKTSLRYSIPILINMSPDLPKNEIETHRFYGFVTTIGEACVCVCAKFDQFLPVRPHFDTKRPVNFFHIATFPSPTFGPLFAFHCPLFFTKNNNLHAAMF